MQIVNIGTLYNLSAQKVQVPFIDAVGLCVISAAFPRYTLISPSGGGDSGIPLLRGHKVWLPSSRGYQISYPDTWAGNVESTYGNFDDFEPENPTSTFERKAYGRLRAIIFHNAEEFERFSVGKLEDVHFIPQLEGLNSGQELYSLHNVDFDLCSLQFKNASAGYFNCFRIEEGNSTNPNDVDNFDQQQRTQLGYLSALDTGANECNNGFMTLTNVANIRILQVSTDVTLGSQRTYAYMRFQDGNGIPSTGKRQGKIVLKAKFSCGAGATVNFDIPTIGNNTWAAALINTSANAGTSRIFRMMQRASTNTYVDTSSDVIASGAHGAGAARAANNWGHGGHDLVRCQVTSVLASTWELLLSSFI